MTWFRVTTAPSGHQGISSLLPLGDIHRTTAVGFVLELMLVVKYCEIWIAVVRVKLLGSLCLYYKCESNQ